jgi:predicted helicase
MEQWLSAEAEAANRVKRDAPVMVVLGNPPYSVSTQNHGQWIQDLISDYKAGLTERNIQPLSDDYIKFIRYGQYYIDKNGSGILAYISNNSFIDGLIHRNMRKSLLESFDAIYILNLHGNSRKSETIPGDGRDENIFDIQQGVSVNIFVKTGRERTGDFARVFYHELYAKRQEKYAFLLANDLASIAWRELSPLAPQYFFVPKNFAGQAEYETGFKTDDLFEVYTSGIKTHDNESLVGFVPYEQHNCRYYFHPFDIRYINYDLKKVKRHRYSVMKHILDRDNIALLIPRQAITGRYGIFIADTINDINYTGTAGQFGAGLTFPLYLYPDSSGLDATASRRPNLNQAIVDDIANRIGLRFIAEKEDAATFAPIDLLDYIYAVLHSPMYREKYREFLKIDFPRVPYPQDAAQFRALAAIGAELRKTHLLEGVEPSRDMAVYPSVGNNTVEMAQG